MKNSENVKNKQTVTKVKRYPKPVVTVLKDFNNSKQVEYIELINSIWSGIGSIATQEAKEVNTLSSLKTPSHIK